MQTESKAWWKGSFPTWIVAAILGVLMTILVRDREYALQTVTSHGNRLMALETSAFHHAEQMQELKRINIIIAEQLEKLRDELRRRP